jgi:hypothetical protein
MALVALGATGATVPRFRRRPLAVPVTLVHFAVYGSLYALFVGATLHAADARSGPKLEAIAVLDVLVSIVPMMLALRLAWTALESRGAGDA